MADDDIRQMIDDCESVKDIPRSRGGPGFSEWELDFLESVADQFDERGTLTEKQREKLRAMWDRV